MLPLLTICTCYIDDVNISFAYYHKLDGSVFDSDSRLGKIN